MIHMKRWIALFLVLAFVVVSTVTTVISLGSYCLTSDGGNTTALPKKDVVNR